MDPGLTMAAALREAGVRTLNISLDTLDRKIYARSPGAIFFLQVTRESTLRVAAGFEQIKLNWS